MTQADTYIEDAHRTASDQFNGEMVPFHCFKRILTDCIVALRELDAIKKTLFYGRPLLESLQCSPGATNVDPADTRDCHTLPIWMTHRNDGNGESINLLHGVIGKATESGELLEALYSCVIDSGFFDRINAVEEVGDGLWYDALILKACKSDFEQAQTLNIAKLRRRFPDKFTAQGANVRDLPAERAILEGKAPSTIERAFIGQKPAEPDHD